MNRHAVQPQDGTRLLRRIPIRPRPEPVSPRKELLSRIARVICDHTYDGSFNVPSWCTSNIDIDSLGTVESTSIVSVAQHHALDSNSASVVDVSLGESGIISRFLVGGEVGDVVDRDTARYGIIDALGLGYAARWYGHLDFDKRQFIDALPEDELSTVEQRASFISAQLRDHLVVTALIRDSRLTTDNIVNGQPTYTTQDRP